MFYQQTPRLVILNVQMDQSVLIMRLAVKCPTGDMAAVLCPMLFVVRTKSIAVPVDTGRDAIVFLQDFNTIFSVDNFGLGEHLLNAKIDPQI